MKRFLLLALLLLVPTVGWAQGNTNTLPPACTAANIATCVPQVEGTIVRMMLGANTTDCTTDGGSTVAVCQYDGSDWMPSATVSQIWTGANGETIANGTDSKISFINNSNADTTLQAADSAGAANLILAGTTTGTVTLGLSSVSGNVIHQGADTVINQDETATFGAPNTMTATPTVLNQIVGIPKLGVTHTAALANGETSVAVANPLLANCSAVANGAEADDATNYITGAASYKYTWAADVAANDGIDCVIAYPAVNDPVSLGFWFRTDTTITSGDIDINFDDGGVTDGTISTFAVTVLNEWQWVELDITTACVGECASVDGIEFLATTQGAVAAVLDGAVINIDQLAMWKAADETAIGDIQVGGLIDFSTGLTTPATAGAQTEGTEWTTYFINYQTGADAIVPITDLSATYGTTLEALN